ncbi:UNVERIFIED_CONTAM: Vacuolar protein sorting-associated protein 13a [Sesamum calycinum]|uniref:Vacuolar protein sorting-associated protein 13a n=1 Tax=Sesamum calycinum TaxID=2727403 RepID=A0AAW2MM01_9LAMI
MFFNDFIKRRLTTLLQPWLRDDQELELKLGFLRSKGTLNNISFNTSALNELLDDPSIFCFKEATVERLHLQFSPFSSSAFTLVVHGLRIVLSLGEEDEGGVKWRRKPRDTTVEERNKVLEEIDPEGCALHAAIKKISDISTRTWRMSLLNTFIKHCHLQLYDVDVLLQSSCLYDQVSCSLYMKKFGAGPRITGHRCFATGLMSSFFVSFQESSFDVDINSFEIRLHSENHMSCIFPGTNLLAVVDFDHLQSISLYFHVPALKFLFSPADLSVIVLLYGLLSKEYKCARPGRQLWNIAASKLSPLSNLSLIKVVRIVCLWLRYIKTYQSILLRVGYPAGEVMKRSATLLFWDSTYSRSVKSQWKLISQIENDLPHETIAVARRIARYRVASSGRGKNGNSDELLGTRTFSKLQQILVLILSMIGRLLVSFMRIWLLHKILVIFPESSLRFGSVRENSVLQRSISLKVQEISVSVSPDKLLQPSLSGMSVSDTLFMFAPGNLKVLSFSAVEAYGSSYSEEHRKKEVNKRQMVVWGDPAQLIYFPEATHDNVTEDVCRTSSPHLDRLLGKLWLNWKNSCLKPDDKNIPNVQAPWILCEIWSCLTDHNLSGSNSRFDCSLVVGKLNVNLEYNTFASTIILLRQIKCALSPRRRNNDVLHAPAISHHLVTGVSFEICNIEFLVSSNLEDNVGLSSDSTSNCDSGSQCLGFEEPQIDIPKSDNGAYSCQWQISHNLYLKLNGLKACYDATTKNKKDQIIVLRPATAQLMHARKDHHSFGSSVVAVSAAFHFVATGFSCLMFLDELYVLTKIIFGVLYESLAFTRDGSGDDPCYEEASCRETVYFEFGCGQTFSRSKRTSSVTNSQVFANSTCELKSFDMVLHNSRRNCNSENYMSRISIDREAGENLGMHDNSRTGVYISIQQAKVDFLMKGWDVDVVIDMTGVQCIIFRYLIEFDGTSDRSELKNILHSLNFLTEASVYHSKICFSLRNLEKALSSMSLQSTVEESSSHGIVPQMWGDAPFIVNTETLRDHWLFTNFVISGIYITGYQVKDMLVNEFEELKASFSVGGEFQAISCECKGGSMLLEATALTMLIECFTLYYQRISDLWPSGLSSGRVVVVQSEIAPLDGHSSVSPQQVQLEKVMWDRLEASSVSLLHLSLILVERDESGRFQELLFEIDFHFSLESLAAVRKISFSISKFSMLSKIMYRDLGHKAKFMRSPFSILPDDSLSNFMSKDTSPSLHHTHSVDSNLAGASGTSTLVSQGGSQVGTSMSNPEHKIFYISPQRYIQKDLRCFVAVEGPVTRELTNPACSNNIWIGSGSISGFDMTISLSDIKMLLSALESLSKVSSRKGPSEVESKPWSYNQEPGGSMEEMFTDGAIVAIQDVDQHMYIAVGGTESRYDIAGAIHYSLVGERALFRVKYQKPRRWKPQVQYFSLISLHAKDKYGESLRLNCNPRSRIVDISCSSDSGSALWRMLPVKRDAYEDAIELQSSVSLNTRAFHLVNKKNDCAVAFIDGSLEFVSKPGNLFKWKVFDDPGPVGGNLLPNSYIVEGPSNPSTSSRDPSASPSTGTNSLSDSNVTGTRQLRTYGNLLGITITVDKVTLTIVHELSDTAEKFPLLQGSLLPNQTIIQISNSKVRVMNTFEVVVSYFDAHKNSWEEFIRPLAIYSFYSQKFCIQGVQNSSHGVPSHFYAKIKEVTVLLSELSLDILLFVIGKLDLAGPYAVKSSAILANCCKVLKVVSFYGDWLLILLSSPGDYVDALSPFNFWKCNPQPSEWYSRQEKALSSLYNCLSLPWVTFHGQYLMCTLALIHMFSRHLALANRPPEASFFSVKLVQQGFRSTSPIHLSLLEAQRFAWRTRIVSSQDSKSFPGPFIVVEISKGIEDGLSIVVSPLLKIHNETDFSLELRFQRPQHEQTESASLILKAGEVIDDAITAFSAIDLSGGSRKALTSLNVGNYVFSFRPNIADGPRSFGNSSIEWSDELKGGKTVRLSGLFNKLSYRVRKAFSVNPTKFSLSSASCAVKSEVGSVTNIYFLIQTVGKAIPIVNPDSSGYAPGNRNSPVAMQEQKELFLLPTIQVNLHLVADPHSTLDSDNTWSQATISSGSAVNFYANPATIYFVVTLTSSGSSCKPVNSSDWLRKLQRQKGDISHLDIELDFGGGKYSAMLRLSRGQRGTLQAGIFTSYVLQNDTDTPLFCFSANQKPLSRGDIESFGTGIPLELGSYLPPNSTTSWFLKCHKLRFKLLEEKALEAQLDLDVLSGLAEIDLEGEKLFGSKDIMRLGVSLRPSPAKEVSSQIVSLSPRYVICNESEDVIAIQQCYLEDMEELIAINSKQRIALRLKTVMRNNKETSIVENLLRKHTKSQNDSSFFIQFRPNETSLGWSGPICVASLGRFFLKFRNSLDFPESQSDNISDKDNLGGFAAVHVVEEGSTIVLHFHRPPITKLPYRIENCLHDAPITYYQKGSSWLESLGAGVSVNYVWDDLTLPHKLVVQLDDVHLLREINLDKVRSWKPFYRNKQTRETVKVGFEVYADGVTRVLRICEFFGGHKANMVSGSCRKMQLRISYFSVHLLEHAEQSLSVDEKWVGAPFAAMLRRHQSEKSDANEYVLHVAIVLLPMSYSVKQVKYLSIVLQPLDVNLDEETLMKIVPFWRRSLSDSNTPRQQYYFDHFEIHPIKIVASFLPGDLHYNYSSTQETLRSLLHSVIKIPAIKRKTVELNGVLVTHALITLRELTIKCAQHYSWYAMRAIYIAKGSPLLPPAFASIFDDLASSSLDVFFDPSSGLLNLPGVTLGTLKLISKFIDNKGFSGTKRYLGDLGKTLKTAGSNVLFAAVTEISDSVLKGAEASGFNGMVNGFHQGILKLALEPSVLSSAFLEGGPDRKIKLDRSPGVDELYIEGYLQAMLDTMYKQEYLRVRVIENQVILKNLPPSSSLIDEIMEHVKGFLESKALLKGESSTSRSLRRIRGERVSVLSLDTRRYAGVYDIRTLLELLANLKCTFPLATYEWRIGPTVLTLCEHLFVSFMIRMLRKQSGKVISRIKWKEKPKADEEKAIVPSTSGEEQKVKLIWKWGIGKFVLSGIVAYVDGRLCRNIPNPLARRIVSGFLLSFLDKSDDETK